ncbi:MAG: preprotein translocase subunit SecE [Anaerolineales bacterium]|nr:preprotein translocase subunit SecE [Anaerolineales bacterium]
MPEKKAVRQQMNFFQRAWDRIKTFVRETIGELHKVSWPSRKELINLTWIVLLVIGIMAIFLGALDLIYSFFFDLLI